MLAGVSMMDRWPGLSSNNEPWRSPKNDLDWARLLDWRALIEIGLE